MPHRGECVRNVLVLPIRQAQCLSHWSFETKRARPPEAWEPALRLLRVLSQN